MLSRLNISLLLFDTFAVILDSMLKETLRKSGLNSKEIAVYLVVLELGSSTIADIKKKSKLPRSTVYDVMVSLESRGLVFSSLHKKTQMYAAHDPGVLLRGARDRVKVIEEVLPELKALYQSCGNKPAVRYYQGREEIREMYEAILKMRGLQMYDIICSEEAWLEMDRLFAERFTARRASKKIRTRLILDYSSSAFARKQKEEETYSEVKIIPPGLHWSATAGCYIFTDRVIFLGYKKEQIAVEILSSEISQLMRMNFEFMWRFLAR